MKASTRNILNNIAKAQKRKNGPPKVSKYAAKNGRGITEPEPAATLDDLAAYFNG